jgi:hypothetical protein
MLRLLTGSKMLPGLALHLNSLGQSILRSSSGVVVIVTCVFAMALVGHSLLGSPAASSRCARVCARAHARHACPSAKPSTPTTEAQRLLILA